METTRLAVLPNWLGDLVMAEPALRAWRSGHRLVAVAEPALAALVEDAGIADVVEVFDRRGRDRGFRGILRCGRRLRRFEPQQALVLGPSLRAAALAWTSGATDRRGLGGEGRELFLTEVLRSSAAPRTRHLADTWLGLAASHGVRLPAEPRWKAGETGRAKLQELRGLLLPGPFAVFAAGARFGSAKQWDASHFVRCAQILRERAGLHPVFVGSPAEGERILARELAEKSAGTSLAGRTELPALAALLEAAAICVANDSGPMHLASALGTPTVGIFGSTSPAWTAPRGPNARVIGPASVDCTPCFLRTCPYARECYATSTPSLVAEAALSLLERTKARTERGGRNA